MSFRFKQFFVEDNKCAMKVGTDGVLLGCFAANIEGLNHEHVRILDIGTGSGLIALMLAQKNPSAQIDAIDIDAAAVEQAKENFEASPWKENLHAYCSKLQDWKSDLYDLLVCNPPYFNNSLKNPDEGRQLARHTDSLSYEELIVHSTRLLKPGGELVVILPADSMDAMVEVSDKLSLPWIHSRQERYVLSCYSYGKIITKPGKPAKRAIMFFRMVNGQELPKVRYTGDVILENENGERSEDYKLLAKDYYL